MAEHFHLTWSQIKPPPGGKDGLWMRLVGGCAACKYNMTADTLDGYGDSLKVEENVLDLLRFSAVPMKCEHFVAFMKDYAARDEKRKAIAQRITDAAIAQATLLREIQEDERQAGRGKKNRRRGARHSKPSRVDGARKEATGRAADGGLRRGGSGGNGPAPETNRRVVRSKEVRNNMAAGAKRKRTRKADVGGN